MREEHIKRFEAPTPWSGKLFLELAADSNHAFSGSCWCQPKLEEVPPGVHRFVHRRNNDAPYVELLPPPEGLTVDSEIVF